MDRIGGWVATMLDRPIKGYEPSTPPDAAALAAALRPADVILVEGNSRVSAVIKYLTQSTWSHAAMYVGPIAGRMTAEGEPHVLVEANLGEGVVTAPLSKYREAHVRVCRPVGLTAPDRARVVAHMHDHVGLDYDVKNVTDMLRYLVPLPVPTRWRRRMIAMGSGEPTRTICSTLIAQAFESVRYPILPRIEASGDYSAREILHIRHHSLFAPRDFDLSPYFAVVKPTIERGFDYRSMVWGDDPAAAAEGVAS
ncbi:lipo-like protein [Labrys wisconsinensis]|uniref:Lipo-like protein n=1 Tax=Labrys wisconsinensis TaxID=425677 RepID=A0ABU0J0U7_9HYPH|nr:lipo-like protein [Labrys wisconsinensis]MDQ0467176.1 hypothetical protein [Labrys wisconsinensis]